jgi:hypothetical protein
MIKEEVIVHRERIQKLGEQKYFQIELPRDVKRIIGIETGAFRYASGQITSFGGNPAEDPQDDPLDYLFKISFNDPIGRLTLQTQESPGIIYQGEVRQTDKNWYWADFTQALYEGFFDQYSHDRKRYEDVVTCDLCTTAIEGHYKDSWGEHYSYHVEYDLLIYIWIEKKYE